MQISSKHRARKSVAQVLKLHESALKPEQEGVSSSIRLEVAYSTLRGKTDKLEEAVKRELNVTRS